MTSLISILLIILSVGIVFCLKLQLFSIVAVVKRQDV